MSYLPILAIDDYQDWEKSGYYQNYNVGMLICPTLKLLPFYTPNKLKSVSTVSTFSIKQVVISNGVKTVVETTSLSTALLTKVSGVSYDNWYYQATINQTGLDEGIYEFYILLSDGTEYQSELFCIPNANTFLSCAPDYNDDFSNDFKICN